MSENVSGPAFVKTSNVVRLLTACVAGSDPWTAGASTFTATCEAVDHDSFTLVTINAAGIVQEFDVRVTVI